MAGYILVDCKVIDAARYETYKKLAQEAVVRHGGRYLVRGGENVLLEGTRQPNRVVVLEFPSLEAAKGFYASAEYVAARAARAGAADMTIVAVAGA